MWSATFGAVNLIAIIAWAILVFLPRRPLPMTSVLYLGVGLLCLIYSVGMAGLMAGVFGPGAATDGASFLSIEGLRALFSSDGAVVTGWTHYLAFDLFTGLWVARDADAKNFPRIVQTPILLLIFVAGPLGLFLWLFIREKRARQIGRAKADR